MVIKLISSPLLRLDLQAEKVLHKALCDECEDEQLSSLLDRTPNLSNEEALKKLRETWQNEIKAKRNAIHNNNNDLSSNINVEMQAKYWFEKGISLEKSRNLYDAVACYRRATQLIPDIEFKYYYNVQEQDRNNEINSNVDHVTGYGRDLYNVCNNDVDLLEKFEKLNIDEQGNCRVCEPEIIRGQLHISDLPSEVIIYILKWVVSSELDYRSLEQLSGVCRGFYVISRDSELWRLGCVQVWGKNKIESAVNDYSGSWRRMFIERPRLNYNGAYISRTTYVRQGENSFQDVDYKPCYLVEYYRYMRFFPDGTVLMLNTPENPYQSLSKLRWQKTRSPVLTGYYRLTGSTVTAVLKRTQSTIDSSNLHSKRSHVKNVQFSEQEFHILLDIKTVRGRRNFQLCWKGYSVICRRNNQETVTTFDLSLNKFPPLSFSRVKSYTSNSHKPLM